MGDISILLDEKKTLQFDVELQGIKTNKLQSRFIVEGDELSLSFDGKFDNDTVTFNIPILAQVLEPNTYKCRLECIVEGEKFFTPIESDVEFILPVKVRAGLKGNTIARTKEVIGTVNVNPDSFKVSQEGVAGVLAPETIPPLMREDDGKLVVDIDAKLAAATVEREQEEMKRSIEAFNKEIESKEGRKFEVKNMPIEIKELNEDGTFSGYGSVFGVKDSYNDVVEKGAFTKTLNERKNVKLLWQHDSREPIGIFTNMYEDEHGLVVKGSIAMDVQRGKEAYTLIKMGAVDGLSIGYSTITAKYDKKSDIRYLKELKLYEVSVVTFPANEAATVTSIKGDDESLINTFIKSLQSRKEPIEDHSMQEPVDNHLGKKEADDNSDVEALEKLVKSLKLKGKNNE